MDPSIRRQRVLAGITRSRLLAVVRAADGPLGIQQLAEAVDLHPNTVREHLDQLVEVGLVTREVEPAGRRGRPRLRYTAEREAADHDPDAYRALATVLAEELSRLPDPAARAVRAGEGWGRALVVAEGGTGSSGGGAVAPSVARARVVELLEDAGFAPERTSRPDEPIRLRRCPFASLARERAGVVCNVHLGLMRGALRELGAPLDGVRLEPFVQPDLCLAHLGADAPASNG